MRISDGGRRWPRQPSSTARRSPPRLRQRVAEAAADLRERHRITRRSCRDPRRRRSGEPDLCSQQGARLRRGRDRLVRTSVCRRMPAWPRSSIWSPGSTPTTGSTASSCSCRCRPPSIRRQVIAALDPAKDVDGFHPMNVGHLWRGEPGLVPCTPQGIVLLLRSAHADLVGSRGGRARPLADRRAAGRGAAAGRRLHGHGRAFENPRCRGDLPGGSRYPGARAVGITVMVKADWIKPGRYVIGCACLGSIGWPIKRAACGCGAT